MVMVAPLKSKPMTVWIPRRLPPAAHGEWGGFADLSDGSPIRRLIDEAQALGIDVLFEPASRQPD